METINNISNVVKNVMSKLNENKVASTVLALLLGLYAVMAAPKLPRSVVNVFNNFWVKLAFMAMIGYLATKQPSTAIIAAFVLLVSIQTLSAYDTAKTAVSVVMEKPVQEVKPEVKVVAEHFLATAEEHRNAAAEAESKGEMQLAQEHQEEAKNNQIIAESLIKAEEHKRAAVEAETNGDMKTAQEHHQEAETHLVKVEEIVSKKEVKTEVNGYMKVEPEAEVKVLVSEPKIVLPVQKVVTETVEPTGVMDDALAMLGDDAAPATQMGNVLGPIPEMQPVERPLACGKMEDVPAWGGNELASY